MCYPCRHCGRCELKRPRPLGVCPLCKHDNGLDVAACTRGGCVFPPKAGVGSVAGEKRGEDGAASTRR